ncbi:MAG: hypothetical protein OXF97_06990 [Nitrospira sp.]|nr:hypothetical protein [Nitrospira sp.]
MSGQSLDFVRHASDQEELFRELLLMVYQLDKGRFENRCRQLKDKISEITTQELRRKALDKMLEDSVTWVEEGTFEERDEPKGESGSGQVTFHDF